MSTTAQEDARQNAPLEAATVGAFVTACEQSNPLCEYKLRMAVLDKINTRDAVSICIKDASPQKRVIAWLKAHPETHAMATEDGLYEAYKSLYPCGRS